MSGSRASASGVLATSSMRSSSSTTPGPAVAVGRGPVQQDGLAEGVRDVRGEARATTSASAAVKPSAPSSRCRHR